MELENLKTAWTSIDERLEKKEILNSEMVKGMLKKKSNKSLRKLKWADATGMIIGLPLIIYIMLSKINRFDDLPMDFWGVAGIILVSVLFLMLATQIVLEIYAFKNYLLKVDFSKNLKENIHYVNMYGIAQRKSWTMFRFCSIPLLLLLVVMIFREPEHTASAIGLFFAFSLVFPFAYWVYRSYNKYIQSLKDNLTELSELEE